MNSLFQLDAQLTSILVQLLPHNIFFDTIFSFLSLEGIYLAFWLLALAGLFFIEGRKNTKFIGYFVVSFVVTVVLVNYVIKNAVQRPRPWMAQKLEATHCPKDYSFPSTHAAGAFAGAVILSVFDKKKAWSLLWASISDCTFSHLSSVSLPIRCHYWLSYWDIGKFGDCAFCTYSRKKEVIVKN